jgi:APA family basic amino acid/polyamine antiporter
VVPLGVTELRFGGAQLLASAIVIVLTVVNLAGATHVARLQNLLTATKLTVVAALLLLGFTIGHGDWAHFSQTIARGDTPLAAQFAVSLVFVFYAYSGWNAAVYVAEEIREPEKTLPFAILAGTLSVTALYLVLNVLYVYGASLGDLKYVNEAAGKAALLLFGDRVGGVFNAAMAIGLLATVNAMSMIGPRVYYAMAKNGAFFPVAARIHPKWQSPWVAVLAQGVCCVVLILTGTFESLANYIGFTLFLFSALSVLALLKFRRRPGWKQSRWVSIAYPAIPLIYVAMNAWVFVFFVRQRGHIAAWSLLTVLAGVVAYHYSRRVGGRR